MKLRYGLAATTVNVAAASQVPALIPEKYQPWVYLIQTVLQIVLTIIAQQSKPSPSLQLPPVETETPKS